MMIGNEEIEEEIRERIEKKVKKSECRNGGGEGEDIVVVERLINKDCEENIGVDRRI